MLRNELLIYFPQKEFYGGDTVTGYAELRAPMPLQTFGVKMDLLGREFSNTMGKEQENIFYKFSQVLIGAGSKDRGRDWFGLKKRTADTISAGTHKYPFSVKLPDVLPPSILSKPPTSNDVAGVEYELKVTLEAAGNNSSNLVSSARIPVGGSLFDMNFLGNNSTPIQERTTKTFMFTKGALDVVINLDSRTFLSGDTVRPRIDFFNKTSKSVNNVEIKLLQRIEVHASGRLAKADEFVLAKANIGTIPGSKDTHPQIELAIPTTAPESVFSRKIASGNVGKVVQISYLLTLHGSISMATDLDMIVNLYVARRTRHTTMLGANSGVQSQIHSPLQQFNQAPPPQQFYSQQPQQVYNLPPPPSHLQQQQQQQQQGTLPPASSYHQMPPSSYKVPPQSQQQQVPPVQRQQPPPQQQQQRPQPQQQQQQPPTQIPTYQHEYVPDDYGKMAYSSSDSNTSNSQPQLQPTYEPPQAFYPTLDDYDTYSYNPNAFSDSTYNNTINQSLNNNSNHLDKHLDMMEQQFLQSNGDNNNKNNRAAYDEFFE